jgi:predicted RNA-binding protein Jag
VRKHEKIKEKISKKEIGGLVNAKGKVLCSMQGV